jgi:ribonuclease P protein component
LWGFFIFTKLCTINSRQTLGSTERLKSRKIIELLFKEGKSVAAHPIRITYKKTDNQANPLQAGFSVSSRNFKKAVDRNRIKRLMRESFRKQKSTFLGLLNKQGAQISMAIFIIYTGKELPVYEFVDEKMRLALKKLADQSA